MKTRYFSETFVNLVKSKIQELCGSGACISYNQLVEACGLDTKDLLVVREVINLELKGENDGDVEIVRGKMGGIGIRGLEHPSPRKKVTATMDQEWLDTVKAKLDEVLKTEKDHVSADIVAGLLNVSESNRVRKAVALLDGFEMAKGVGIRRVKTGTND